ncbi:MAG TPA: bifunctional diaminohydroxyphosphoribosylaminopyrimidine deaminase/5-amino-6-(5-phosphoribosylamino)uracil reductase RibD [Geobacteraceae bacterium]
MSDFHEQIMRRAIALARKGVGKTSPNPAVGCVIIKDGAIVGEGWHRRAGTPHAEVHALAQAGERARGADVYVTLEPCAHYGKTPPCAEALIAAGVGRVFAGMVDPNPKVCGKGVAMLREAGITVTAGLLEEECRLLNEPFIKQITTGLPFVTLKCALTLDGKIATAAGDSRWITNEKSRRHVHRIRGMVDAVLVGSGTVRADDPQLTCRIAGGRDPLRVVVDSTLTLPHSARIFGLESAAPTLVATVSTDAERIARLERPGVEVLSCGARDGRVDLEELLRTLARRGIQSLLLEGGGVLAGEALRVGLVDKFLLFYAPKLVGGDAPGPFAGQGVEKMAEAFRLRNMSVRRFGDDLLVTAYPEDACLPA